MCRYKIYVSFFKISSFENFFLNTVLKINIYWDIVLQSVRFEVPLTDARVNKLVRVGTWHSVITSLSTPQTNYITSNIKPNKRVGHKFLSIFEDKQRAWQWKIHYYICYHFNAILTCVNIHINLNSLLLWHAFQNAQSRGRH